MAKRYQVQYGWCLEGSEDFFTFECAVAFAADWYASRGNKGLGPRIVNTDRMDCDYQGDPMEAVFYDGLTEDEREVILEMGL